MKYVLFLGALFLLVAGRNALASEVALEKTDVITTNVKQNSLQELFVIGLFVLEQRDYKAAIAIFSDMLKQTNSPRVRLELARALFLDRQFNAAKANFQKVLRDEGIPWSVKQNIRLYLNQLDNDIGYMKFGISFISDSNPENFTSSEEVNISGRRFKVVKPSGDQAVVGISYNMNSAMPLSGDARVQLVLNLSFSDFEGSDLDRWIGDVGVVSSFEQLPKVKAKLGIEYSEQNGKKRHDFSYLGVFYTPNIIDQFRYGHEFKVGKLVVDRAPYLDADIYRIATNFTNPLVAGSFVDGGFVFEKSIARESPYSYQEGRVSLGLDIPLNDWGLKFSGSYGVRLYGDVDPFFGERRRDKNQKFGFLLSNKKIHSYGYKPEIGITFEQNDSSLSYFSYDKVGLIFSLKESY